MAEPGRSFRIVLVSSVMLASMVVTTAIAAPARADDVEARVPLAVLGSATHSTAAQAAAKPTDANVTIVMKTPMAVPVGVHLLGKHDYYVAKPAQGRIDRAPIAVRTGVYRVTADDVVMRGRTYRATLSQTKLRVVRGHRQTLRVMLHEVRATGFSVTAASARSVSLVWKGPGGVRAIVRRANGSHAPQGRTDGMKVRVKGRAAVDRTVDPGKTYAFALFQRMAHTWQRSTLTVGVPTASGSVPSYVLAPGATLIPASLGVQAKVIDGQMQVRLPASSPRPALGSGISLPPSALLPGGFLGTVASISPDGRTVVLAPGGLADVFTSLDLSKSIQSTPIELTPITNPEQAAKRIDAYHQDSQQTQSQRSGQSAEKPCGDFDLGTQISNIHPILKPHGHFDSAVKSRLGVPYAATFDISAALEVGFRADLESEAEVSCGIPFHKVVKQVAVDPVPLVLTFEPILEVDLAASTKLQDLKVSMTGGAWAKARIGSHGSFSSAPIHEASVSQPVVTGSSASLTLKFGGEFDFGPGVGAEGAGVVAGINGYLYPLLAKAEVTGAASDTAPAPCVTLSAQFQAGLGIEAKAWAGHFKWSATWQPDALRFTRPYHVPWYFPAHCDDPVTVGTGDFQATLTWNSAADLDLHVIDPDGNEIYFDSPTSPSGGELDVDANAACASVMVHPTENIFWPHGGAPPGEYQVWVNTWSACGVTDLAWHLVVRIDGQVVMDQSGFDTSDVYDVTVPG